MRDRRSGRRILVIEDEPSVLRVLVEALRSQGFEVSGASTSQQALAYAASAPHDAMLTDCRLPGTSGIELHRKIREIDTRLAGRTFFMSGSDLTASAEEYVRATGLGFFLKPFDATAAARRIVEALDSRPPRRPARGPAPRTPEP